MSPHNIARTIAQNGAHAYPALCIASPRFLTVKEVASRLSISRSTEWRLSKTERFPRPTRIGVRTTRWRLSDLEAYEASRRVRH